MIVAADMVQKIRAYHASCGFTYLGEKFSTKALRQSGESVVYAATISVAGALLNPFAGLCSGFTNDGSGLEADLTRFSAWSELVGVKFDNGAMTVLTAFSTSGCTEAEVVGRCQLIFEHLMKIKQHAAANMASVFGDNRIVYGRSFIITETHAQAARLVETLKGCNLKKGCVFVRPWVVDSESKQLTYVGNRFELWARSGFGEIEKSIFE